MWKTILVLTLLWIVLPVVASAQTHRAARVISERANLRETPTASGNVGQEVAEGTVVKILDEKLPWYVARLGDRVGWMHGDTLQFISANNSAGPSNVRNGVVREPRTPSGGRAYIRGPRGGCYYFSGSGRKVYVDRSLCN